MKTEQEYIRDLTEIRSMMERSSKFLSLTGWSGIMAGLYALGGAYLAYRFFYENRNAALYSNLEGQGINRDVLDLIFLALAVLILAVGTAAFLSYKKSRKDGEKLWNSAARRVLFNMAIPLVTGGIFILILLSKGLFDLTAPATLIFYGLALLNAGNFTYVEIRSLGIIQILLGLIASYFVQYSLIIWVLGFGAMHIVYGIYMHLKYEK